MKKIIALGFVIVALAGCGGKFVLDANSTYCTADPTTLENGAVVYPIDEKYGSGEYGDRLFFLGQVFTAARCGDERLAQFMNGDDTYGWGSHLLLYAAPSGGFLEALKEVGYECDRDGVADEECDAWVLYNDRVDVSDLLKIEPYYEEVGRDDCVHCG